MTRCKNCNHLVEECLPGQWLHGNKLPSGAWYHGVGCSMGIKRECNCRQPEPANQQVWVFCKEGFLSIASSEFEKDKLEGCLGVKPKKAKLIYL